MEQLYRVGDTDWWILVNTEEKSILEKYHKPQVKADIASIIQTLSAYPNPTEQEEDLKGIVYLIDKAAITVARKNRAKKMLEDMWMAYEGKNTQIEAAQLRNKLEYLQGILIKMA